MSLLDALRRRIDALDEDLVRLLSARASCALEIGRVKKDAGLPVYQPEREAEVIAHVQQVNSGPLDDGAIRRLFERVIDEARRLERLADREGRINSQSPTHNAQGDEVDRNPGT
ncbi:MAG TPA: chorismate mutase [Vicinamibacterales bacterium]|nr:chorismate mutase [Vicinamibacterales bacterium]